MSSNISSLSKSSAAPTAPRQTRRPQTSTAALGRAVDTVDLPAYQPTVVSATKPLPADFDAASVRSLMSEIAPLVSRATGWPLDLTRVQLKFVDSEELSGAMTAQALARAGFAEPQPKAVAAFQKERMQNTKRAGGWYGEGTLFLNPKKFPLHNGDAMRSMLFQLLVHASQEQNVPDFLAAARDAERAALVSLAQNGQKSTHTSAAMGIAEGRAAWLFGQAIALTAVAKKQYFGDAKTTTSFSRGETLTFPPVTFNGGLWHSTALTSNALKGYEFIAKDRKTQAVFANPEQADVMMAGVASIGYDPMMRGVRLSLSEMSASLAHLNSSGR